ncbi:hypothetical protein [Desulfosediminicola flagellatus]|uniref:hypothetical protein n=1 Tax=Desulfosediminicola flagellatus TaxID=2569541 RepID=UPI0010AD4021|nr:hypothetical protein [Desulfosediminicola flagellatus]
MELEHVVAMSEDRERLRLNSNATVKVETVDRRVVEGQLRDIGMHSLYLFTHEENDDFLIHGEPVKVKVKMRSGSSNLIIEAEGNIARMDAFGFVVQFNDSLKWWPVFTMFPISEDH